MLSLVVVVSMLVLFADSGAGQQTVPAKLGTCPPTNTTLVCSKACRSDGDCQGRLKCCPNGCGTACLGPVLTFCDAAGVYCGPGQKCEEHIPACTTPTGCTAHQRPVPLCVEDKTYNPCPSLSCPAGLTCITESSCPTNATCTRKPFCVQAGGNITQRISCPTHIKCQPNEECIMYTKCTPCAPGISCPPCFSQPTCFTIRNTTPNPTRLTDCTTTLCAANEKCDMQLSCATCAPGMTNCPVSCSFKPICVARGTSFTCANVLCQAGYQCFTDSSGPKCGPVQVTTNNCNAIQCGTEEVCVMAHPPCPTTTPCPVGQTCPTYACNPMPMCMPVGTPTSQPSTSSVCLNKQCAVNEKCVVQQVCPTCLPGSSCTCSNIAVCQEVSQTATVAPTLTCPTIPCPQGQLCIIRVPSPVCENAQPTVSSPTRLTATSSCDTFQCNPGTTCTMMTPSCTMPGCQPGQPVPVCTPAAASSAMPFTASPTMPATQATVPPSQTTLSCPMLPCPQGQQCVIRYPTPVCENTPPSGFAPTQFAAANSCDMIRCGVGETCAMMIPPQCPTRTVCQPGQTCPPNACQPVPACLPVTGSVATLSIATMPTAMPGVTMPAATMPTTPSVCLTKQCAVNERCVVQSVCPTCLPGTQCACSDTAVCQAIAFTLTPTQSCPMVPCPQGQQCVMRMPVPVCESIQQPVSPSALQRLTCAGVDCGTNYQCVVEATGIRCVLLSSTMLSQVTLGPCYPIRCITGTQCVMGPNGTARCDPIPTLAPPNPCDTKWCALGTRCIVGANGPSCEIIPTPQIALAPPSDLCETRTCGANQVCVITLLCGNCPPGNICPGTPCVSQAFCAAKSNPCEMIRCNAGFKCAAVPSSCNGSRCEAFAICRTPCDILNCGAGQRCIPPPADCVGSTCPAATCVAALVAQCEGKTCKSGEECITRNDICLHPPCAKIDECVPMATTPRG